MKHIIKVQSLQNLLEIRPLIAMDNNGNLEWLAEEPVIESIFKYNKIPDTSSLDSIISQNSYVYESLWKENISTTTKTYLVEVQLGKQVTEISDYAFEYEKGIGNFTMHTGVTRIGNFAFHQCENLQTITIPNSVTSIGQGAFRECSSLASISIPNSVASIGEWAFSGCAGLTSVTIPNNVTGIGSDTFNGCNINTINFIGSIEDWCRKTWYPKEISQGYQLYLNGELQEEVIIPNTITSIEAGAFYNCTSLASVTIPNSVTSIEGWAFRECSGLTSLTIGNSVTSIGYQAFYSCAGLTSITCEALTPPTLGGTDVFYNTNNCPIYVPSQSVDAYKAATNWLEYTDRIQAIQ